MITRAPVAATAQRFDLAVIGGGIHGVCLALQAAERGLRVLLLECADFGSGASGNSLRVVHGGLRYLDYFVGLLAGSVLDTGAKLEVIAIISGFATMYGAMQAAPASKGNETPSPEEQTSAQIQSFIRAAASGDYPNLAAALATAGPQRTQDDVFESSIQRLIDGAGLPDKPSS